MATNDNVGNRDEQKPLRALTTLRWPFLPDDDKTYVDPLTRNDPRPLRMVHYESVATSPRLRELLTDSRLRTLLARLDALHERDREHALQLLIGATEPGPYDRPFDEEDVVLFTGFARAVEEEIAATEKRMNRERLGLDWDA